MKQTKVIRYKQKAAMLFEKLQSLQRGVEQAKSSKQKSLIRDFQEKENRVMEGVREKDERYSRILKMVGEMERQLMEQRNQQEKCERAVKGWVQTVERELNTAFQGMQKEKEKSQAALEKFVESRIQSFVLKNKGVWNQGAVINTEPFLQEIEYLNKEHRRFLEEMQKECGKLKRESYGSLKELIRLVQEQINRGDEEEVTSFMKRVHMEINAKINGLREQRERTEEKVLAILQRVVNSCMDQRQIL